MKKIVALTLALLLMVSMFTACGSGSTNTPSAGESVSNKPSEDKGNVSETTERQEIVMWGSWSGDQIDQLEEQISVYNASQD